MGHPEPFLNGIADDARVLAGRCSVFCDPRLVARASGFAVCQADVSPWVPYTDGVVIWYPEDCDVRTRGASVLLGLARALLLQLEEMPMADDVVCLANSLAVHKPTLRRIGVKAYVDLAIHLPEVMVRSAVALRRTTSSVRPCGR